MPEGIKAAESDISDFILNRRRALAHGVVGVATAGAATVGAVPIPFPDAAILAPLEGVEINSIARIYGIKEEYFPYIYNDKIYYQDDNDKCKMHVCNMDGSNDKALINNCIYQYIIDGEYIYYKAAKKCQSLIKIKE